jgi:hypothetical protein
VLIWRSFRFGGGWKMLKLMNKPLGDHDHAHHQHEHLHDDPHRA